MTVFNYLYILIIKLSDQCTLFNENIRLNIICYNILYAHVIYHRRKFITK